MATKNEEKWLANYESLKAHVVEFGHFPNKHVRIPVDTRSPIPVISVQSVGDLQYRWQS